MTPKKILIGPTYQGLVDSEDHARLLIRTYINSKLFCPQQPEKQNLARLIRSGYVLLYEENERGMDFWSDGDDWTFIGFDESIRICRNSSTPTALMRKEFSMAEGGTHYGLAAYCTGEAAARSHMNDSSGLRYEHKLEPTMSRGPWEIIRLSAKDADRQLKTNDLDGFTVYDIPYLQQHKNGTLELVITQSSIPEPQEAVRHHSHIELVATKPELQEDLALRYDIKLVVAPTEANSGEVDVYGMHTARAMACERFLNTAIEAIRTGRGQGPEWCYHDAAKLCRLEGRLKKMLRNEDMDEESIEESIEDDNDVFFFRARI